MSTSGGGTDEGGKPETTSNEAPPEETSSSTTADADAPESPTAEPDVPAEYPESPAPVAQATNYPQLYAPHLTPQPGGGYYMYQQAQITPEPPSPAGPNGMYDAASFRHLSSPFGGQYGGIPQPPLSPRSNMGSMGSIPPASPLFPRVAHSNSGTLDPQQLDSASLHRMNSGGNGGPPSPAPYLSPPLGPSASPYGAMYQGYGGIYNSGSGNNGSEDNAWSDRYVNLLVAVRFMSFTLTLFLIRDLCFIEHCTNRRRPSSTVCRRDQRAIGHTPLTRCFRLRRLTLKTRATRLTLLME